MENAPHWASHVVREPEKEEGTGFGTLRAWKKMATTFDDDD